MLFLILYLSFFTALIVFFLRGLYFYYKSCKEEEKEWEDFIKSLTPGSEWILQPEPDVNPFYKSSYTTIVTIVETRKNSYGDIWVRYKSKNTEDLCDKEASEFKKLYNKLN